MSSPSSLSHETRKPFRWQFRLRSLFILILVVGVLLPAFGTPVLFDLMCLFAFARLAIRFRQRRLFAPLWTLLVIPSILVGVSTPFILLDDQLTNWCMVGEVGWCTAVLSIAFGICGSLIVREWSLPRRFYPVRFGFAAVLLVAGIGLYTWKNAGCRGIPYLIKWSSPSEAGGAHFNVPLPGRSSSPEMNYIRQGRSYYSSGARIDLAGLGLFYVRSRKSGYDVSVGPFFVAVIPYWVMFLGGGAGVIHYSNLRAKFADVRFSPATWIVMLAAMLFVLWINVQPYVSTNDPVLRAFGYPLRYLRLAIEDGEQLDYYMGYSLGWQLDQLMLNVLLAGVLILIAGVLIERIRFF